MKPKVYKYRDGWWNINFREAGSNKLRTIFADSWEHAMHLVKHGYRNGYFA
jgi:hypothetical protein